MGRFDIPDHPEIACIERTGYPSWMQEDEEEEETEGFWKTIASLLKRMHL